MDTKQINLKLASNLYSAAISFAESYGYRNLQELVTDSLREKLFEKSEFDGSFSERELELIDTLIEKSVKKKRFVGETELMKALQ